MDEVCFDNFDHTDFVWVRRQAINEACEVLSSVCYDSHEDNPKWIKRMAEESLADMELATQMNDQQRDAISAIRSEENRKLQEYQRMLKKIKIENHAAMLEI